MESIYFQTDKLVKEVQQQLLNVTQLRNRSEDPEPLLNLIKTHLNTASSNCDRLEILVQREPPSRRQNIKIRINQLKLDISQLQMTLKSLESERLRKLKEEEDRNLLLNTQFTTNSRLSDTTILIDRSINHHNSLQNANRGIDDLIGSGTNILENLRNQRVTLKSIQRRFMDVANTLGLSNTTMRQIERRAREDKFIFYGGIIITLLVILLVIIYLA